MPGTEERLRKAWASQYSPKTRAARLADIQDFRRRRPWPLEDVDAADIQSYLGELTEISGALFRRKVASIRAYFAYLHENGAIQANPAHGLEHHRQASKEAIAVLTPEEVSALITAARSPRDRLLVSLVYHAALTAEELTLLRWSDLRLRGSGPPRLVVRGWRARRQVELPEALAEELLAFRGEAPDDRPIFPSRNGDGTSPLHPLYVHERIKQAVSRSGLKSRVTIYTIRHSLAQHRLAQGTDKKKVMKLLGHRTSEGVKRHLKSNSI